VLINVQGVSLDFFLLNGRKPFLAPAILQWGHGQISTLPLDPPLPLDHAISPQTIGLLLLNFWSLARHRMLAVNSSVYD